MTTLFPSSVRLLWRLLLGVFAATAGGSLTFAVETPTDDTARYLEALAVLADEARASGQTATLADAAIAMVFDNYSAPAERVGMAREAVALARREGDPFLEFAAHSGLTQALLYADNLAEATTRAEFTVSLAQEIGEPSLVAAAFRLTGMVLARHEDPTSRQTGEVALRAALSYYFGQGDPLNVHLTQTLLADLLLRAGRPGEALPLLEVAEPALRDLAEPAHWLHALELKALALSEVEEFEDAFFATVELHHNHQERWKSGLRERLATLSLTHETTLLAAQADTLRAEKARADLLRWASLGGLFAALFAVAVFAFLYLGKRRAETTLRQAHAALAAEVERHLEHLAELKVANSRLKETDEERKRILGIAAHDLKNPIGCIQSSLELLRDDCAHLPPAHRTSADELMDLAEESIDYLNELVQNILQARSNEHRAASLAPRPVEALPLLESVLALNELAARKKKMTLWIETAGDIWVSADPQALREALDNVVSNAIKYSFPGAVIRLRLAAEPAEDRVEIEVFDGGPGIQPRDFDSLFRPFSKLSAQPTGGESSTGLGLSGAKVILQAMDGTIDARNCPEGGACFRLRLPAARPLHEAPEAEASNRSEQSEKAS